MSMRNKANDFVEIEPGYFIEYKQFEQLLDIGLLPWEMRAYITKKIKFSKALSKVGTPLSFQEKIQTGKP